MDETERDDHGDLVSRLEVIEAQPLASRAAAYESLHDELSRALESGPAGLPHRA
ncbi:hypothetical protein [Microbacterium sp. RU33B]|uniref:hypothetical protein n=1 Tax=Microbacterium sp. RU33B TaxID=1907390 RepID=UPI00095F5136|nr:hypothetical protein [Microbacterium sp. RU33B]SIT77274.1 hypothetical protein SAMN05880545_1723 [Microbacterium sp. RU33B]